MLCKGLVEKIRRKSVTATLLGLVAPLLLLNISIDQTFAADAPNFKVHVTNSASTTGEKIYLYNKMKGIKSTYTIDSSDNLSAFLADGEYNTFLFSNQDESSVRVSSQFRIIVTGGVLSQFYKVNNYSNSSYQETSLSPNGSGVYNISLGTTGFRLFLTAGNETKTALVETILGANNLNKPINPTYYSNGSVGVDIDPGTYNILGKDADTGDSGSVSGCVVVLNSITDCEIQLSAPNFIFRIVSPLGDTPTSSMSEASISLQKLDSNNNIASTSWIYGKFSAQRSLQDGKYRMWFYPTILDQKLGRGTIYAITVASQVVTEVKSYTNSRLFSAENGVYLLSLNSDNFRFNVITNGSINKNFSAYFYTSATNQNSWTSADSVGNSSLNLPDGQTELVVSSTTGSQYVSTRYTLTTTNGNVTEVRSQAGETLAAVSGLYSLTMLEANVQGSILVGGQATPGNVQSIYDLLLNKWVTVASSGWTSTGSFGLSLPVGSYLISVLPNYNNVTGAFIHSRCEVTSNAPTTCNITAPAINFNYEILSVSDTYAVSSPQALVENISSSIPFRTGIYLNSPTNGSASVSLQNGEHSVTISSRNSSVEGNEKRFTVTVVNGAVTSVRDDKTGVILQPANGKYSLKLGAPNFRGVLKANGLPNPNAASHAYQQGFNRINTQSNADGLVSYDLPNGRNTIYILTTGNESPTAASTSFFVTVESSTVVSVEKENGDTLTATNGIYSLDYLLPNIVGTVTVGGIGTSVYVQSVWNTVLNKTVNFGGASSSSSGKYSMVLPAGNYDILFVPSQGVGGVQNCNAIAGEQLVCNVSFPMSNLNFAIKSKGGIKLTTGVTAQVTRRFTQGQSFAGNGYTYTIYQNSNGQFVGSLVDGNYELSIFSSSASSDGVQRTFSFTVESGTVGSFTDLDTMELIETSTATSGINLGAPNFAATVLANNQAVQNSYGYIYSNIGNRSYSRSFNTDTAGKVSLRLPDGEYKLLAYPSGNENPVAVRTEITIVVESNTVISVLERNGQPSPTNSNGYVISLGTPNLTGVITVAGQNISNGNIWVGSFWNEEAAKFVNGDISTNGNGTFYGKVDPGNYLVSVVADGKPGILQPCNVSDSASVCNFNIPAENFKFKIQDSSGTDLLQDVSTSAQLNGNRWGMGFGFSPSVGGIFRASLFIPEGVDSFYSFTVQASDGSSRHGVARTYKVTMSGESITSVVEQSTGIAVIPNAKGIYGLKLGQPNVAGTVVAPDGTTPIPNSGVTVSGENSYESHTDNSGAFAMIVGQDGTYTIWASAPDYDLTKADSPRAVIEVANGIGNANLQLKLRTPTVRGTVSGPKGVSSNNYIQVLKLDSFGNYNFYGMDASARRTNTQGRFAFYLEPGVYKFQTEADDEGAGGGRTVSNTCTVTDTSTVIECPIILASFNLKIKVNGVEGSPYTQGSIYFNYIGNKSGATVAPTKTWDYAGLWQNGSAKLYLDNGQWQGNVEIYGGGTESPVQLTVEVESGTVKSLTTSTGDSLTVGSDGYYLLQLPSSNLVGTIFEGTTKFSGGASVNIHQVSESGEKNWSSRWVSNGKFAFKAAPGTYTIEVYPYANKQGASTVTRTIIENCVVPSSGIATCDVALAAPNFSARITSPSGTTFQRAYANLFIEETDQEGQKYFNWYEGAAVNSGQFGTYLKNGRYRVEVAPYSNEGSSFVREFYEVIVESSTVQSVKKFGGSVFVTSNNGQFALALSSPALTGRVFKAGSTTAGVRWAQIIPIDVTSGEELWEYSTQTSDSGRFAMALPDGNYFVVARLWGQEAGEGFSSSAKYPVAIAGGSASSSLELFMREPNFTVRVVDPTNSSVGLSQYWISGNFNDQYFGGTTDENGYFKAFIDTSTTSTCSSDCRIYISPQYQTKYSASSETFTAVANTVFMTPRVPNAVIAIQIPTNGDSGVPDKWSWFSIQTLNSSNEVITDEGFGTNELGRASVALTSGAKYRITAYPSGDFYGRYSPKVILIDSFDPVANATISIRFDSPNVTFLVRDLAERGNAWGWFVVSTVNGETLTQIADGYLNESGRGALYLQDGDYSVRFFPGKSRGVEKTITFTVTSGHVINAIGATFSVNDVGTVIMGAGNVTGTIRDASGVLVSAGVITATTTMGAPLKVTAITKADGTYELSLDPTRSWSITALNPITEKIGAAAITANSGSTSIRDISLAA